MHEECLALLGRFDEALSRRKVRKLNLTVTDPVLKTLIDQHKFFGSPSILHLKKLELRIVSSSAYVDL